MTPETAIAPRSSNLIALDVGGMKCAGCVQAVEQQLSQQTGVISATVNLVTEVARVEYEPAVVDPMTLAQKLTELGFPTQPRSPLKESTDLQSSGSINVEGGQAYRSTDRSSVQPLAIALLLLVLSAIGHLDHFGWHIAGLSNIWFHFGLATLALLGPGRAILVDGWRGLRHNFPNMNTLVGMGTLTAYTASTLALLFPDLGWECFFDEPVMLVGFILLGRTLEQRARRQASASFQSLLTLKPTLARLVQDHETPQRGTEFGSDPVDLSTVVSQPSLSPLSCSSIEIPADRVKVGAWLQVLPGDKIPVDGIVLAGQTTVNESMLTGESLPALKQPGDRVSAGALNQSGAITIQAIHTGQDTVLAQMIALVEEAQTRKAPIQKLADRVAGYFTYGVMTLALLTFLFWYFIGVPLWSDQILVHGHWMIGAGHAGSMSSHDPMAMYALPPSPLLLSLKLAIAVLVVACPCALGLATPTAILVGSGIGAERGLLIRGGDVLEKVYQIHTIVFDKTGTLTEGHPTVTDCLPLTVDLSPETLLQWAATVESGAEHPLAEAIRVKAEEEQLPLLGAEEFYTEPGLGVSARIGGQVVWLGNYQWLAQQGIAISPEAQAQAQTWGMAGKTVVYVAVNQQLIGLIAALDQPRSDAKATVQQLRHLGFQIRMLTGDQADVAQAIAHTLDLAPEEVSAGLSPADKVEAIAQLQFQGQGVAMVGDGINDAAALAQADVSISLYSGTDIAVETAEIILMRDHLADIVESIRLSRATFDKIRQNLFWAFVYNILSIPAAAGIFLPALGIAFSPAVAGVLMAFSSVSVVSNSLLLRRAFSSRLLSSNFGYFR